MSGIDGPPGHDLLQAWREGGDPGPDFDRRYYLRANPDVAASGIDPFLHYVHQGYKEGRLPRRPMDAERSALERARSPAEQAQEWRGADGGGQPLQREGLRSLLQGGLAGSSCLILSISHDDYSSNWGGVQNLLREEARAFSDMNAAYLHLSPAQPLPMLAAAGPPQDFPFMLRLGQQAHGRVLAGDLAAILSSVTKATGLPVLLVVHHLRGHAPEAVSLLASVSDFPIVTWTHDYFTVCPSVNLMRNDVRHCGTPPPGAAACDICVYGEERAATRQRLPAFFERHLPIVLAPSEAAARVWRRGGLSHRHLVVQPLARLVLQTAAPRDAERRPIRIAFLGQRAPAKGWPAFEKLARRFARDPRYAFFRLGVETLEGPAAASGLGAIHGIPVRVTAEEPEAMIDALAAHGIDVVVNWAPWPETFCYAAAEALAGGAFLLARSDSGNVAAIAGDHPASACVIPPQEEALHAMLEGDALARALAAAPPQRGVLLPEGGTAAWFARSGSARPFARAVLRRRSELAA